MRFLADMVVSLRVVEWLRNRGDDVVHLRDQGLQRLPNGDVFAKATAEGRIVLTFDLDFGEIVALSRGARTSIVVFRLRNTRTGTSSRGWTGSWKRAAAPSTKAPSSSSSTHVIGCVCFP